MRITRLRLGSFGGLSRKEVELGPDLNIVLGPNESGKSTLFAALEAVFTEPSRHKGKARKDFLDRYLPIAGGDTVDVTVEFETSSGAYLLEKRWGEIQETTLNLPGGGRLTGDEPVNHRLTELLGFGLGTLKSVFLTRQSGLDRTLDELGSSEGRNTLHALADLLQAGFLEAEGISVARFQELLEARHTEYFSNWDIRRDAPKEKKGHSSGRWTREVGLILAAYYDLEDRKAEAREIEEQEKKLGEFLLKEKDLSGSVAKDETYFDECGGAFEDIDRRGTLEARLETAKRTEAGLNEEHNTWLTSEGRRGELEKQLAKVEEEKLRNEKVLADLRRDSLRRTERFRYERLVQIKSRLETLETERRTLPDITREEVKELREAERRRDIARGKLESGRVRIELESKKEMEFTLREGSKESGKLAARPGEPVVLSGEGRLSLEHADWSMTVSAGAEDSKLLEEELGNADETIRSFLTDRGLKTLEEAEEILRRIGRLDEGIGETRNSFEAESKGISFEDLERKFAEDSPPGGSPGGASGDEPGEEIDLETAERNYSRVREEYEGIKREADYLSRDIAKLEEKYETPEKALDEILSARGETRRIEEELAGLAPLPEGYQNLEEFRQDYRNIRARWERNREDLRNISAEIDVLEKTMPEMTAEAAADAAARGKREFERIKAEGFALDTVKRHTEAVLDEVSKNPYAPLTERVSGYLNELTRNRYSAGDGEGGLPAACVDGDNTRMGYGYLSAGTKDVFALALRLAMAEYFGKGGMFFVLDDPFVDLDPERRRTAAGVVERYAEESQCILFTCHPAQAELFAKAKTVEL
jgi:DNA repair exonuclease SbcCD ATPase subunit